MSQYKIMEQKELKIENHSEEKLKMAYLAIKFWEFVWAMIEKEKMIFDEEGLITTRCLTQLIYQLRFLEMTSS